MWEDRERRRIEFLTSLDRSRVSLARGEGRELTQEAVRQLTAEVKERGRAASLLNCRIPSDDAPCSVGSRGRSRRHLALCGDRER
jgi:hypothetical protein